MQGQFKEEVKTRVRVLLMKVPEINYAHANNLNLETREIALLIKVTVNSLPNLMYKFYECLTVFRYGSRVITHFLQVSFIFSWISSMS